MNGEAQEIKEQNETSGTEPEKIGKPVDGNQKPAQPVADELQQEIAALEDQLKDGTGKIGGLEEQLGKLSRDFEGAKAAYAYAVEDYKKLAATANPMIPAESISGTTIEEVKSSLDRALKLAASVKSFLQSGAVPAGAPARSGPETSAMSSKEKINFGLEQARKKKE